MPADLLDIANAQQASIARDVASQLMQQEVGRGLFRPI